MRVNAMQFLLARTSPCLRSAVWPIFAVILMSGTLHAHENVASIRNRFGEVQILVPQAEPADGRTLLSGVEGAISLLSARLFPAEEGAPFSVIVWFHPKKEPDGSFTVEVGNPSALPNPGQSPLLDSPQLVRSGRDIADLVCGAIQQINCSSKVMLDTRASRGMTRTLKNTSTGSGLELQFGTVPTIGTPVIRLSPQPPGASRGRQRGVKPVEGMLTPLVDQALSELPTREQSNIPTDTTMPPGASSPPKKSSSYNGKPRYFVVHCAAFYLQKESALRWVQTKKDDKLRSSSTGYILVDGTYAPVWPLEERPVWATKTETCYETQPRALNNAINVELFYSCGYKGSDSTIPTTASDAQYNVLSKIFLEASKLYGPLIIVSHREVDRGLKDAHQDPIGFSFKRFSEVISAQAPGSKFEMISDSRHMLPSTPDLSHKWPPSLSGPLVREKDRTDDCKRDHRNYRG